MYEAAHILEGYNTSSLYRSFPGGSFEQLPDRTENIVKFQIRKL
jgi:hypothetical protein